MTDGQRLIEVFSRFGTVKSAFVGEGVGALHRIYFVRNLIRFLYTPMIFEASTNTNFALTSKAKQIIAFNYN